MSAYERAVQRGELPAITIRQLVDAVRQDIAGCGAAHSSLRYLSEKWPQSEREPIMAWIERAELHLERMDAKCSSAIEEYYETLPSGDGATELAKARRGEGLTDAETSAALRAAMEVADRAKERGREFQLGREIIAEAVAQKDAMILALQHARRMDAHKTIERLAIALGAPPSACRSLEAIEYAIRLLRPS